MKVNTIRLKVFLLFIFSCLSWFAIGRANIDDTDKNLKLLQGEWRWEAASIPVNEYETSFDFDNDYIKFYSEIEIKGKVLLVKDNDQIQVSRCDLAGSFLGFDLPSGESIIAEWTIIDDELYLEYKTKDIFNASKKMSVLLLYKRK
ncbi:hypothetical protein GGR21_001212 [Dysgonomonas hofstadii]|uniref:Lipocalin-like domain-containing protein n=1 Tax=Dysgonomonas hofstadii TaxID=637886 RepID=A0A840CUD5_9BACT|nr:hypothetical protein [Dysgonomonas hofstadii]MBB4035323.1 hypothetical protein [Dysgonomonas hofstadii]